MSDIKLGGPRIKHKGHRISSKTKRKTSSPNVEHQAERTTIQTQKTPNKF